MNWPGIDEYEEAMQNPSVHLLDALLRTCKRPRNPTLGIFEGPYSGQFAVVFRVIEPGTNVNWAVRCFLKHSTQRQQRYETIEKTLKQLQLPCMVEFHYLARGIKVGQSEYAALKMPWVKGKNLVDYITENINQPTALLQLADHWLALMENLHRVGIAHGDLQHENVLVVNGQLKLVDYDGMYVPSLANLAAEELGMMNYQHPDRTAADFGDFLDNFSSWIIYVSLVCFAYDPKLWDAANRGDNKSLLFTRADYESPKTSTMFKRLLSSPVDEIKELARILLEVVQLGTRGAPRLEDHLKPANKRYHAVLGLPSAIPELHELESAYKLLSQVWDEQRYTGSADTLIYVHDKRALLIEAYTHISKSLGRLPKNQSANQATPQARSLLSDKQLLQRSLANGTKSMGATLRVHTASTGNTEMLWDGAWVRDEPDWQARLRRLKADSSQTTAFSGITAKHCSTKQRIARVLRSPSGIAGSIAFFLLGATLFLYPLESVIRKGCATNLQTSFASIPQGVALCKEDQGSSLTTVIIDPFAIGNHEVTQAEFETIMGHNPSKFWWDPNKPVENVSAIEAKKFIARLNQILKRSDIRLPKALEWEYAATRTTKAETECTKETSSGNSRAVMSGAAGGFGVYDLAGNVSEWCSDGASAQYSCKGCNYAMVRGSSPEVSSQKSGMERNPLVGFRLARGLSSSERRTLLRNKRELDLEEADLFWLRGDKVKAASLYQNYITPETISSKATATDVTRAISLATVLAEQNENDRTRKLYLAAFGAIQHLPEVSEDERLALQRSLTDSLLKDSKNSTLARDCLLKTIELLHKNSHRPADLVVYVLWLGTVEYSLHERSEAKQALEWGLDLASKLPDTAAIATHIVAARSYLERLTAEERQFNHTALVKQWRDLYDQATNTEDRDQAETAYRASMEVAKRGGLDRELSLSTIGLSKLENTRSTYGLSSSY